MKAVLLSIQPKYCELIASGKKTIEVRKTRPKIDTPFKCYIYCTKIKNGFLKIRKGIEELGNPEYRIDGKVIGEFVCDRIDEYKYRLTTYEETPYKGKYITKEELAKTCLSIGEVNDYLNGKNGYFWHITDLKIYDKPKELGEYGEFYIWKKCNSCRDTGYESTACCFDIDCKVPMVICRPPQSWQYVESLGE